MFEGDSADTCAEYFRSCWWGDERTVKRAQTVSEDPHWRERKFYQLITYPSAAQHMESWLRKLCSAIFAGYRYANGLYSALSSTALAIWNWAWQCSNTSKAIRSKAIISYLALPPGLLDPSIHLEWQTVIHISASPTEILVYIYICMAKM